MAPEGKNIKISQVRALKEKLYYLPREKGTKVCIIEEAELLTTVGEAISYVEGKIGTGDDDGNA